MLPLSNKKIILGVTGGVAAYKSADLVRRLMDQGAQVQVVMTHHATQFVTPTTFQALSGQAVFSDTIDDRMHDSMAHIHLSRHADAILIVPCTANFMAKLAHGLADDLLSTLCLAKGKCPLLVAPAMNTEMWQNPATQRNVRTLKEDGVQVLGPAFGEQACGEIGQGRLLEVAELVEETIAFFQPKKFKHKHILITAGPTQEVIDPVRVISNISSGKTGYAIAQAAYRMGAQVTLVSGPTALNAPYGVKRMNVHTARQMHDAVMSQIEQNQVDIFISVAAVADWYIKNASPSKIKKGDHLGLPTLEYGLNPDILAQVARLPHAPWCVGFAAETEDLEQHAQAKRQRKGIPLLVGNLAQHVMGKDSTQLCLFSDAGMQVLPNESKAQAAIDLLNAIATQLELN